MDNYYVYRKSKNNYYDHIKQQQSLPRKNKYLSNC